MAERKPARPTFDNDRPVKPKKTETGLEETMECALKATMQAEYWRGQADALKWCMRDRPCDYVLEAREGVRLDAEPEPEAKDDV